MKIAVRAIALSLVLTGLAAGALNKKTAIGLQVVPASVPMPNCPLGQGDCGIGSFPKW
jgi:hypothetical protein